MSSKVAREHVQHNVQSTIGIEVKVSDQTSDFGPNRTSTSEEFGYSLGRRPRGRRVRRTHSASYLYYQLAITLRLFSKKVELVLFVTG
jgi:hypothetical protein